MQRRTGQFVSFFSLLTTLLLCAFVAIQNETPGETMARMHELGEQLATPNENHAFLSRLSGTWNTKSTIMNLPEEQGTASHEMTLGGRFLEGSYGGPFMGVQYKGRMTLGYDNYKKKFVAMFINTLGTSMQTAEGMLDRPKTTLSLWGTMDEWMTDEHDKPVLYQYRVIDDDHFNLEIHDLGIAPRETLVITVKFERVS